MRSSLGQGLLCCLKMFGRGDEAEVAPAGIYVGTVYSTIFYRKEVEATLPSPKYYS